MDEQHFEYRTGQTHPQKNSRGIIAFLLICVIFLCGVVSVLGFLNIHLLTQLRKQPAKHPLSFAEGNLPPVTPEGDSMTVAGITVQELPGIYQQLHRLPAGLYVVDTTGNIPVEPGDVLVSFDGTSITSLEALHTLFTKKKAGDQLWFTFSRQGKTFSYSTPFED